MTTARDIAARDQAEAKEREFERRAMPYLWAMLIAFGILGTYAFFATLGWAPAAPWSPLGKA